MRYAKGNVDDHSLGLAEAAEKELEAQLAIVRTLKTLTSSDRERVLKATALLVEADALVPGIIKAFMGRDAT